MTLLVGVALTVGLAARADQAAKPAAKRTSAPAPAATSATAVSRRIRSLRIGHPSDFAAGARFGGHLADPGRAMSDRGRSDV